MERETKRVISEAGEFTLKLEYTFDLESQVLEPWKMNLLAANAKYLFVGCRHKVCVYSQPPARRSLVHTLQIPKGPDPANVQSVNFIKLLTVSSEEVLGVVTMDANILLFSVTDLDREPISLNNYSAHYEDNSTWSLDACGDWVVAGSNARTISCWNMVTGEIRRSEVHRHNIPCVNCVPGTSLVLTASIDSTCRVSTFEGAQVGHATPSHSWGWFVSSIPRNSINLSATNLVKLQERAEYVTTRIEEAEGTTSLVRHRGTPTTDDQLRLCGLLLYATAGTIFLVDPMVKVGQGMHVLCEYVPMVASLFHGGGRISLAEYIPEWGVCVFACQFKHFVSVVQFTKTRVEATQQYVYFISLVTVTRINGRVMGLTVKNCVDQSSLVWIYVLTENADVTVFSLSKKDELLALRL